ncbi:MAG TPA: hypothetical protein VE089_11870 [Nitrososphaeraceae archaeon]|jgi:hypothetical protein|nr:hypothetical protein [Nitrososphaeraceae archaeon]
MLDKFFERFLETAYSAYKPKLEEMSQMRTKELRQIKEKVRKSPDEVELWFDREIEKVSTVDVSYILNKMKALETESDISEFK